MKRLLAILLALCICQPAFAAFSAPVIWEVQTGGDDTNNGGGFNPGSSNFATDLTVGSSSGNTATVDVSATSYTFVSRDVGHWLFIKSGTNFIPGWYKISSVLAGHAILDATAGHAVLYNSTGNQPYQLSTANGVATTASPSGGTWSIDYSQGTAIAFTDMVIDGTTNTKFTSAAKPVGPNFIGNVISVTGGTGFTVQRVEVISTSSTVATCDKSLGTLSSTGGTGSMGGPLASPGLAGGLKVAGNSCFIKTGTYTLTSSTANVTGGKISDTTGGSSGAQNSIWEGYDTYRTDKPTANRPVISAGSVTSITILAFSGNYIIVDCITVDGNSQTSTVGFDFNTIRASIKRCKAQNTTSKGFTGNGRGQFLYCQATGCSGSWAFGGGTGNHMAFCEAWSNSTIGFLVDSAQVAIGCLSYGNTGANTDGFQLGAGSTCIGCVSYGNGRHGFQQNGDPGYTLVNCIAEGNTGTGFSSALASSNVAMWNCGYYNNGTNVSTNIIGAINSVLGTGSFFTNAASADFSLNATAGAGGALRAVGFPATFPRGLTASYLDIGAAQHQDSGGAAGGFFFGN